ncbi:MAG: alkaline phosphatase PhoX [Actinomycetota bacterium]
MTTDRDATHDISRRGFLRASSLGSAAIVFGGAAILSACDPVDLLTANADRLRLHPFFTSRTVATTGTNVAGTSYEWHRWPDGGACFPLPDGGWSYVSNSELVDGVGFIRFSADGTITDAGSCLEGTFINCAGGKTPWGTWLSCEEYPNGSVWECDPIGAVPGVRREAMGVFRHEAAAADPHGQKIYMTEDISDGGLYRFTPDTWGDLQTGLLEILTEPKPDHLVWVEVPDPTGGADNPTRYQVADTKIFNGGEGIDLANGKIIIGTKGDNRVWSYEPTKNHLSVIYDPNVQMNGVLSGVDNVVASDAGVIYVAEDGGDMQIVLVREDGSTFPVVQVVDTPESEICGPAFDPSGTRLYFSSQRNPGETFEVTGPWAAFTDPGPVEWPPGSGKAVTLADIEALL